MTNHVLILRPCARRMLDLIDGRCALHPEWSRSGHAGLHRTAPRGCGIVAVARQSLCFSAEVGAVKIEPSLCPRRSPSEQPPVVLPAGVTMRVPSAAASGAALARRTHWRIFALPSADSARRRLVRAGSSHRSWLGVTKPAPERPLTFSRSAVMRALIYRLSWVE